MDHLSEVLLKTNRKIVTENNQEDLLKTLQQIMRRIHRIFTHSFYDHNQIFKAVENETFLY